MKKETHEFLIDIIKGTKSLPKISSVNTRLIELINDKNADLTAIGELIALDPELTLLILKLVNSAHFSPNTPVHSVTRAVQLLGYKTVCFIIMGASTLKTINSYGEDTIIDSYQFWIHSFKCALAAQFLATISQYDNPFEGYLVGLFHDIGKIVIAKHLAQKYQEVLEKSTNENIDLKQLEEVVFGFNHADVSALLVTEWHLNETLAEAIAAHHDPVQCNFISNPNLGYYLYFANQICHLQTQVLFDDEEIFDSLNLDAKDFLFSNFQISNYEQFTDLLINPTIEHLDENEHFYQNLLS